jgi:hypothetical protein
MRRDFFFSLVYKLFCVLVATGKCNSQISRRIWSVSVAVQFENPVLHLYVLMTSRLDKASSFGVKYALFINFSLKMTFTLTEAYNNN